MKNKKIIIILILLMAIVCLTEKTYAKTINITSQQYSVYRAEVPLGGNETWTNYVSNGTQTTNNTDNYIILGFRTKFYSSGKYEANTQYQAKVRANTTPKMTYTNAQPNIEFSCYGSTSNSNYNPQQSLITSCQLVSVVIEEGNNFTDYIINFTPTTEIETIQFVILFDAHYNMTRINVDNSSTITTDTTTQDAINSQTTNLINNENQNTQNIIDNQNELLGTQCSNLLNPTLKTATTHRGITFTPIIDYKTNNVKEYNVSGTRTSGSNAYVKIGNLSIKSGTKVKAIGNNKVAVQLWDEKNNVGIGNNGGIYYETYIFTSNYSNVGIYIYTAEETITNEYFKVMISEETTNYCVYGTYTSKQDVTNDILSQDHTYNNNASQDTTNQENQMNNFEQQEDTLRNSLNLDIENSEITINPIASSFIWDVVNRLRAMSGKIVLLFTSVLSLGIMKMILGR